MNAAVQDTQRSKQQFVSLRPPRRAAVRAPFPLLTIVVAIAAFFAFAPRLYAGAPVTVAKFVTPSEVRAGALLLRSEGDRYIEAPHVATDIDVTVSGPTTRGRVTQIFHNPAEGW